MEKKAEVFWFTGRPGSGKTTLINAIIPILKKQKKVEVLDGDELREWLSPEAGFSKEGRERHIRRVIRISEMLSRNGIVTLVSLVSPYKMIRGEARNFIGNSFKEIYVHSSVETCVKRDPKGHYAKALKGEIKDMTGIQDSYEEPSNPELVVNTEKQTVEESVQSVLNFINSEFE
jgi:adenylylsulfate kinase